VGATPVGERLLRGEAVEAAAAQIRIEVGAQLEAALHGPVGTALAAGAASAPGSGDEPNGAAEAQALLSSPIPRTFIAVGAALTIAYVAVSEGDEVRTAGALLCAQRLLFPDDPFGLVAVNAAIRPAFEALSSSATSTNGMPETEAAAAMQRRVAGDVSDLERGLMSVFPHLQAAALGSYSWKRATGGQGPASGAMHGPMGAFLSGLVRWTYYVEAALDGIRRDDWARAGAALIAARRVTAQAQ
jgi:hypothetical protein